MREAAALSSSLAIWESSRASRVCAARTGSGAGRLARPAELAEMQRRLIDNRRARRGRVVEEVSPDRRMRRIRSMRAQDFYLESGPMNGAGGASPVLRDLPRGVGALCAIAQGVLVHRDIAAWLYGLKLSDEQRGVANIRPVAGMIAEIEARNAKPLRETVRRRSACLACAGTLQFVAAMLREQGAPARARCGFGAYFVPGLFEDHWVAEYWSAGSNVGRSSTRNSTARSAAPSGSTSIRPTCRMSGSFWRATPGDNAARAAPIPTSSASRPSGSKACGGSRRTSFAISVRSAAWTCCPGTFGGSCRSRRDYVG